jgi:hypothetical protein
MFRATAGARLLLEAQIPSLPQQRQMNILRDAKDNDQFQ